MLLWPSSPGESYGYVNVYQVGCTLIIIQNTGNAAILKGGKESIPTSERHVFCYTTSSIYTSHSHQLTFRPFQPDRNRFPLGAKIVISIWLFQGESTV
jgi:gamma-glutamyl phosphate reductase